MHQADLLTLLGWATDPNFGKTPQFTVLSYKEFLEVDGDAETYSIDAYETNWLTFGRTLSLLNPPSIRASARLPEGVHAERGCEVGRQLVAPVVNALIDRFVQRGEADLAEEFTLRYPFEIIYRQLALPERDIATFHKLAITMTQTYGDMLRYGKEASRKLGAYFSDMIRERRQQPGTDLVSHLVHAEVGGERIPEQVLVSFFRQLINAAGDTTYRGTGALLIALLREPALLNRVRENRALVARPSRRRCAGTDRSRCTCGWRTRDRAGEAAHPEGRHHQHEQHGRKSRSGGVPRPGPVRSRPQSCAPVAFGYGGHVCRAASRAPRDDAR